MHVRVLSKMTEAVEAFKWSETGSRGEAICMLKRHGRNVGKVDVASKHPVV